MASTRCRRKAEHCRLRQDALLLPANLAGSRCGRSFLWMTAASAQPASSTEGVGLGVRPSFQCEGSPGGRNSAAR